MEIESFRIFNAKTLLLFFITRELICFIILLSLKIITQKPTSYNEDSQDFYVIPYWNVSVFCYSAE